MPGLDPVVWFLGAAVLSFMAAGQRFCSRLRLSHRAVWEELGRPTMTRTSERQLRAVRRFVNERRFDALGDPTLARLGRSLIVLKWLIIAGLFAFAIRVGWPWGQ